MHSCAFIRQVTKSINLGQKYRRFCLRGGVGRETSKGGGGCCKVMRLELLEAF